MSQQIVNRTTGLVDYKELETNILSSIREGKPLTGRDGALTPLIKKLLEASLEGEIESHLLAESEENNRRNGRNGKTLRTSAGNYKDNNLIEEEKIMEDFLNNNGNGSSIFQGKIREQDFSAEQKLNELKAAIEELNRQDLLRKAECERQASSCVDEISSQAELRTEGDDEDYFNCEKPLGDFWSFFEPLFNLFEVNVDDPKIYQMLKEKKEKNLIAAIMKFLRDKLKKLIKKIFESNLDLSWDKRLDKEIKELQEKLNSGELSEEEFARALERLNLLQDLTPTTMLQKII
ncbi:uncharacterized protein TNCT_330531 [Trichonephila clavata]|uniref:Uncharacterized protein n=1 Tax=Trichonephila clavata TaxID=2740835 RepID=A0A8X6KLH1_TRICU|nr:uncharacterized protein TNCT_539411 [Trichonephila clavata]GFR24777.1 uncharacterized protein TNCT_330531 [Trichonephila clavata]